MAVNMMFSLGFATILTLVLVPVLYAVLIRLPTPEDAHRTQPKDKGKTET
jgi:hypothetical protein